MKVYLLRDKDLSKSRFNKILTTLNFKSDKRKKNQIFYEGICVDSNVDIELIDTNNEIYLLTTKNLQESDEIIPLYPKDFHRFYKICKTIREREKIDENDLCILLTNELNKNNFFTWCDHSMKNIMIQTSQWEFIFEKENQYDFAVMYEINAWILRSFFFRDLAHMKYYINSNNKGEIMDLCINKQEMSIKMKTAEISARLLDKLTTKNPEKYPQVKFVREQFEKIRLALLDRDNSKFWIIPVTLRFTYDKKNNHYVVVEEFGDKKLPFDLADRVIYRLLLENEDGIHYDNFNQHKKEIYNLFCSETTVNRSTITILTTIKNQFNISYSADEMERYNIVFDNENNEDKEVNNTSNNKKAFNERISDINIALKNAIPSGIVQNYLINNVGKKNKYKINLDRNLVKYDDISNSNS